MSAATTVTDDDLLSIDLYDGGKDGPEATFAKVVRTRRVHPCWISADEHPIPVGSRAVCSTWMHRGDWGRHYVCAECLSAEIRAWGIVR